MPGPPSALQQQWVATLRPPGPTESGLASFRQAPGPKGHPMTSWGVRTCAGPTCRDVPRRQFARSRPRSPSAIATQHQPQSWRGGRPTWPPCQPRTPPQRRRHPHAAEISTWALRHNRRYLSSRLECTIRRAMRVTVVADVLMTPGRMWQATALHNKTQQYFGPQSWKTNADAGGACAHLRLFGPYLFHDIA